jgi:putative ABC transport system permease protein
MTSRRFTWLNVVMAALASVLGYVASLFLNQLFTANIMLYIGAAPKSILQYLVPIIAVGLIFLIVISYCTLVLRRFNKITAVEALRSGNMGETQVNKGFLPLHKSNFFNVNIFLGIRDVTQRFKCTDSYSLFSFVHSLLSSDQLAEHHPVTKLYYLYGDRTK